MLRAIAACLALLGAAPVAADKIILELPVDCTLGADCFIQQYVDADPGPGSRDYRGGPLSYDGHKGTDLRVADLQAMRRGVPVLAPADGLVRAIRDGMADRIIETRDEVAGRECGNGVVIDHGDGWETQLCHLAQESIAVAQGETVVTGQVLGEIGLSGATQFPHVHLSVRKNGGVVDPFVAGLWSDPPAYEAGGFLAIGLSEAVPTYAAVKAGTAGAASLPIDAEALVVWVSMFGGQRGDTIGLRILGPSNQEVFSHSVALDRTQAELFRAAGRRLSSQRWRGGTYRATATLRRADEIIDRIETDIILR